MDALAPKANSTVTGQDASWLVPTAILSARLLKFGVQIDF
jgi:hypothetical protein